MHNQKIPFILTALVAIVLSACQQPVPAATPVDQSGDGVQDIRVQMVEPIKTNADVEQFPLPNCGGTYKLSQSLASYGSITKNVSVSGTAKVVGGGEAGIPEIVKLKLEIQVEIAYKKEYESAQSRLDSIEMSAEKGTHVVYTIVWEKRTYNSIVRYSLDGTVYETAYVYELEIPKLDKSYEVVCPTSEPLTVIQILTPFATKKIETTDVSIPVNPTPSLVPPTQIVLPTPIQANNTSVSRGQLLYEDTFDNSSGWNMEPGMNIDGGNLIVYPGNDAVQKSPRVFDNFIFDARFYLPVSGSMAFYIRHQQPPCVRWNCSTQIALHFNTNYPEIAARRFLGQNKEDEIDITKSPISSLQLGNWNTIIIQANGSNYSVIINDVFALNFTDNTYTQGDYIIDNSPISTSEVFLDYVRIYALP